MAEEPGQITVRQSRFLSSGDVEPRDDETTWWVPLGFEGGGSTGRAGAGAVAAELCLTTRTETIRDVDDDFYKLNGGATDFFRVSYPPARLAKLGAQLGRLGTEDKMATISSTADVAFAGHGTTAALLAFLEGFGAEPHPLVWTQVLDTLSSVKSVFCEDAALRGGLDCFALKLVGAKVAELGWDFADGEGYLTGLLRKQLIGFAVASGHTG